MKQKETEVILVVVERLQELTLSSRRNLYFLGKKALLESRAPHVGESGKILLVLSGILGFGILSTSQGIQNPKTRLESRIRVPMTKTGIQYLESGIHGVESRIQAVSDSLIWDKGKSRYFTKAFHLALKRRT